MFGAAILKFLQKVGKLLLAPFILLGKFFKAWFTGQLPTWVNWLLELLLVAIVVILLGALNWVLGLDEHLVGRPLMLRKVWLGLVATELSGTASGPRAGGPLWAGTVAAAHAATADAPANAPAIAAALVPPHAA